MPPNSSEALRYQAPRHLKLIGLIALVAAAAVEVVRLISIAHADQCERAWI